MERTDGVVSFVGIDAHINNCSIKAISRQGEDLLAVDVDTSAAALQKALKPLPGPVWVLIESSSMSRFVKESLVDAVDRLIVCETRENRWISRSEDKGDQLDADRLCRLLRMGEFKEVHLPLGKSRERQEVLRLYKKAQGDVSRTKNRIKIKYREHGVKVSGKTVYTRPGRDKYLDQVKCLNARFLITALYKKLEGDQQFCDRLQKRLISLVSQSDDFRRLKEIPGVGDIFAAIFVCLIDDADRFVGKRKLWRFSGLGLCSRSSGDSGKSLVKGAKSGNRLMKYAALGAAKGALRGDNRYSRHYHKMVSEGVDPAMARRTAARKILATALYMLKHGTVYNDDYDFDN